MSQDEERRRDRTASGFQLVPSRSSPPHRRHRRAILVAAVGVVVAVIAGVGIYRQFVLPYETIVLAVDGRPIKMGYFLKRLAMSNEGPVSMLHTLAEEQIVNEMATKPPYDLRVTPQQIDQYARAMARGTSKTISRTEFHAWYQQELNQTRLSNSQFRDLLRTRLLTRELNSYLADHVPVVAREAYLNIIPVKDARTGEEVSRACASGADFGRLARKYSVNPAIAAAGGKVGWFPSGVFGSAVNTALFDLKVGRCSSPIYINQSTVVVIMVSQRSRARKIDQQSFDVLKSEALKAWYQRQYAHHSIVYYGFAGSGYDSQTNAWVLRQVQLMRERAGSG